MDSVGDVKVYVRPFDVRVFARTEHMQGEDGWQREGARGCDGLGMPGEGFSGECSIFKIMYTLTVIQDLFFSCHPHQESGTLRQVSTPGEGFSCECSPFVMISTLTILQDYFFSCNPHKESTSLRRFPPPFNPLHLIK